jgi:uncharacterized protein
MKYLLNRILVLTLLILPAVESVSQDFPQPKKGRIIHDFAEILSPEEERALEYKLVGMNDSTGFQIGIITVKSTGVTT